MDQRLSGDLPPEITRDLFRQVAGSFASGVTAVTTGQAGNHHGMTASSFASLSLDPPLVLVCVDLDSSTLPVIKKTKYFAINILGRDQEHISRTLAGPGKHDLGGIPTQPGRLGVPLIDGCIARFECRLSQEFVTGDHVILVGAVEGGAVNNRGEPLLYFRGSYGQMRIPIKAPATGTRRDTDAMSTG